jgi:hypothetical protein
MNWISDIGDAFKKAGSAIKDAGESTFDWSKKAFETGALAMADGANLFGHGWQEVFSGNFQNGIRDVAFGMAECLGLPPQIAKQYEEAVGESSLWSLQESKNRNALVCYTEFRAKTEDNIHRLGLRWTDSMDANLRSEVPQMPWINPGC